MTKKILILGGTGEAAALARRLDLEIPEGVDVITSLAGRTKNLPDLPGRVISGGFGGIQGLKTFIEQEGIKLLVDATHPFSETISDSAYVACTVTDTLRMTLVRPEWTLPPDGKWLEVDDMAAASEAIGKFAKRTFLTIGTRGLDAFSDHQQMWFLVRLIEQPSGSLPLQDYQIITGRPPHDLDAERQLITEYNIDCLVSKHAGGAATIGKILAALDAQIPIVLIRRPPRLPGHWAEALDDCVEWILEQV